jgi:hypothetical protein
MWRVCADGIARSIRDCGSGLSGAPNGQGLGLRTGGTAGAAYCPIWLAYVRLEDPRGLSPITTLGRFDTVDEAQIATDECGHPDETLALLSRQLNPCPALGPTDRARSSQLMGPC